MHTFNLQLTVATLAAWAEKQPLKTVYVYGSRVRGDHRPDSDLDVAYDFASGPDITDTGMAEWRHQQETDFSVLKEALGVRLQFLDHNDEAMLQRIRAAEKVPALISGKVVCVVLPPKPSA